MGGRGDGHGDEPAARGSDDGGFLDLEVIEQGQGIAAFLQDGIGRGIGPVRPPAPAAVEADQAEAFERLIEIVEVRAVPREAG